MSYPSKSREMKEFIVSRFYDVPHFKGSMSILAGEQLRRVITLADKLNPYEINVYETSPIVFEKQMKDKYKYYPDRDDLQLNFKDLKKADVCEFIDADLMRTYKTESRIINYLLSKQMLIDAERKVFIGTFCLRSRDGMKTSEIHKSLKAILKKIDKSIDITSEAELKYSNGKHFYMNKIRTIYSSNVKSFDVFHYSDGGKPMLTFRIVY